jgi:beta-N-acetylhexosaminidase
MALGATRDPELARHVAEATARELVGLGITMQLGPVADVNTNPVNPVIGIRAFGSTPELVSQMTVESVRGFQGVGVSAVAKHFPGHGDTATDSHRDLPVVEHVRERLNTVELPPFVAAIAAGVDGIMSAHVAVPSVDPTSAPATLSHTVLTDVLRSELGFSGLIVTDALDMRAITRERSSADAAVLAFAAGADLLCIAGIGSDDRARIADGPAALLAAVRAGHITEERLDASVRRIIETKLRRRHGSSSDPAGVRGDESAWPEHEALALRVARRAVTLLRDRAGLLPLRPEQRIVVMNGDERMRSDVRDPDDRSHTISLADAVRQLAPNARLARGETVDEADVIVFATYDLAGDAPQRALAHRLAISGCPVIGVALRGPYDADRAPEIGTYLAVYGDRPVHLRAAADALFGRLTPTGRVP